MTTLGCQWFEHLKRMAEIDQDQNLSGPHTWHQRFHIHQLEYNHVGLRHGMRSPKHRMALGPQSLHEIPSIKYGPELCDA